MAEAPAIRLWLGRASYLGIALVLIFLRLLPLDTTPQSWAPPDILLCVTLAWVARRPDFVPAASVAGVFLLTDMLFQRPPGLFAALVVVATEMLRARHADLRNVPFALEWMTVAFAVVAITGLDRLILAITMTPRAPLALGMIEMVLTVAIYPAVVLASHLFFRVRRPAPGEVDSLGHRL